MDESGPPLTTALSSGPPPVVGSNASSAPPSSGVQHSQASSQVAPATSGGSSVIVGLAPSAGGWFERFSVDVDHPRVNADGTITWLAGSNGEWGRVPSATYQLQPLPSGAPTWVAAGDVDGDGYEEAVVGTGPSGQGRVYVFKVTTAGYFPFATLTMTGFPAYLDSGDASTHPACADLDGDGCAEVVIGTGVNGQGYAQIWKFDKASQGFAEMAGTPYANGYVRAGWSSYSGGAEAPVWPAGGYLGGRGTGKRAQLALGLGRTAQGWLQLWQWNGSALVPLPLNGNASGWLQVDWAAYSTSLDGSTYPAFGDLDGDGLDDLVVGLGDTGQGWLERFRNVGGQLQRSNWTHVPWVAYASSLQAPTRPAVGDLDGDGRADIVVGLGSTSKGWMYVQRSTGADCWTQVQWSAYVAQAEASTWPAILRGTPRAVVSLQFSPSLGVLAKGTSKSQQVLAVLDDGSTLDVTAAVQWSSTNTDVATARGGLIAAVGVGTSTITASLGRVQGSDVLTVSASQLQRLDVTPATGALRQGDTLALTATGTYTDGSVLNLTSSAVWTSSATGAATVSSSGSVSGVAPGTGIIVTAKVGSIEGSATVDVAARALVSLQVTPVHASVGRLTGQPFSATAKWSDGQQSDVTDLVTWDTSDHTLATISNTTGSHGVASALATGDVTVTATLDDVSASGSLTVMPAHVVSLTIVPGQPRVSPNCLRQMRAIATLSDGTTQDLTGRVSWTSSSLSTASFSNMGYGAAISGPTEGATTTLTAVDSASGTQAATSLTVVAPRLFAAHHTGTTISAVAISAANGNGLTAMGEVSAGTGSNPYDVKVDPSGRYLFSANNGSDTLGFFRIEANGSLTAVASVPTGSQPVAVSVDPLGRFVCTANYGDGTVTLYTTDYASETLQFVSTTSVAQRPNDIVTDLTGRFTYLVSAGDQKYHVLAYSSNGFSELSSGPTPMQTPFILRVDPTGRALYAGNVNGVYAYRIGASGELSSLAHGYVSYGIYDIVAEPLGRFLYMLGTDQIGPFRVFGDGTFSSVLQGATFTSTCRAVAAAPNGWLYVGSDTGHIVSMSIDANGRPTANSGVSLSSAARRITSTP